MAHTLLKWRVKASRETTANVYVKKTSADPSKLRDWKIEPRRVMRQVVIATFRRKEDAEAFLTTCPASEKAKLYESKSWRAAADKEK